jgi:phosphoribosylformimino-5-aminoimidazole carboxamide ribotide isomerase
VNLIPVLDLLDGRVVRAVGGRRQDYLPLTSCLTPSCDPVEVARAVRDHYDLSTLYLADLDAIGGAPPAWATYAALHSAGFRLWIDAGVRDPGHALDLFACGVDTVVLGLETIARPQVLTTLCCRFPDRVVFSLDLRDGIPLGNLTQWPAKGAWSIACHAISQGVRRLLVLDLARVGMGTGAGTEDFCSQIMASYPDVDLAVGGGVRQLTDLLRFKTLHVKHVLVASVLYDKAIQPEDVEGLSG